MQQQITAALREYDGNEKDRRETFLAAKRKKIREKQTEYDNLMKNLSTGAFTGKVADDICKRMEEIQKTIAVLEMAEPPKDYTSDEVRAWMKSIKDAPSDKAVQMLIARIEAQKDPTAFNIESTLKAVGRKLGTSVLTVSAKKSSNINGLRAREQRYLQKTEFKTSRIGPRMSLFRSRPDRCFRDRDRP